VSMRVSTTEVGVCGMQMGLVSSALRRLNRCPRSNAAPKRNVGDYGRASLRHHSLPSPLSHTSPSF
jgi:hypothetical protein